MNGAAVLVRGARYPGPLSLLLLGLCLLAGAACLAAVPRAPLWPLVGAGAVLGALCLLASGLWWGLELSRRAWVEVTPAGFRLRDRAGERAVDDQQILSMALRHRRNFSNGLLKSVTRFFTVWYAAPEQETRQLTMTTTFPADSADPLAGLIQRVSDRLLGQARADLQSGLPVLGVGWSLDRAALTLTAPPQGPLDVPLADVTAVDVVDEKVCCWVRGRDEAVAKVPVKAANAYLLLQLLREQIEQRKAAEEGEPEEGRLGRIIFERRHPRSTTAALAVMAAVLGLVSLPLILFGIANPAPLVVGLGLLVVGAATGLGAYQTRVAFFRCHEWGVHQSGLFVDKRLRYGDVASFTYRAVRVFVHGAYTGTTFTFVFDPLPPQKSSRIRYSVRLGNVDAELDNLRDQIARILAFRMIGQLRQGQPVRWTANLCFLPEGLEYRPAGWVGRKGAQVLPYDQVAGFNLDQGTFSLWAKGRAKPVMQENSTEPNFFPGFVMLSLMAGREEGTAAEEK
jgi:hypothetical protein